MQSTVVSERWADVSVCSNALNRAAHSAVTCVSILQAFEKTSVFQKRGGRRPGKTTGGREGAIDRGVWPCWCVGVCGQTRCRTLTCEGSPTPGIKSEESLPPSVAGSYAL